MARIFATPQELADWLNPDQAPGMAEPPENAARLLRNASREIGRLTMTACYDTDLDGLPTDTAVATAFREATCAQAEWAIANGDSTGDGPGGYSEVSVGSIRLKRASASDSPVAQQASGEAAFTILQEAGIVPGEPWVW